MKRDKSIKCPGRDRGWLGGSEGGIRIDLEVRCGCVEVQTDSASLLFSVLGVTQQFAWACLPDTSGSLPLQQEDKDSYFKGFFSCREGSVCSCVHACVK